MTPKELERFESKYIGEPMTGCWIWIASLKPDGYGRFDSKRTGHRVAFEHWHGPIPEGKEIDHICNMRCCVNPAHLRAITHTENVSRSECWKVNSTKTHCPKGHEYSGENLYISKTKSGINRQCNICRRARSIAWDRARKKKGDVS